MGRLRASAPAHDAAAAHGVRAQLQSRRRLCASHWHERTRRAFRWASGRKCIPVSLKRGDRVRHRNSPCQVALRDKSAAPASPGNEHYAGIWDHGCRRLLLRLKSYRGSGETRGGNRLTYYIPRRRRRSKGRRGVGCLTLPCERQRQGWRGEGFIVRGRPWLAGLQTPSMRRHTMAAAATVAAAGGTCRRSLQR